MYDNDLKFHVFDLKQFTIFLGGPSQPFPANTFRANCEIKTS